MRFISYNFLPSLTSGHPPSVEENKRPDIPNHHPWTKELTKIIGMCWRQQPSSRPKFSKVIAGLEVTGKKYNIPLQHTSLDHELTPRIPPRMSPDMRPVLSLPIISPCEHNLLFPVWVTLKPRQLAKSTKRSLR